MSLPSELKAVRKAVDGYRTSLYDALAEIYAFRMKAVSKDNDHKKWNKWAETEYKKEGWKFTKSTSKNMFTSAIRLAFNCGPDGTELDAQPISKYAIALQELCEKQVGWADEKTMVDVAKKHLAGNGISALSAREKSSTDDKEAIKKAKKALDKTLKEAPDVSSDDVLGSQTPGSYHLALVHVTDDGNRVQILNTVAGEDDKDTKKYIREFAESDDTFGALYNIIRFADVAKNGDKHRVIVIQNDVDTATIHASLLNEQRAIVGRAVLPPITELDEGTYILFQEEADGFKHLWSTAKKDWDWSIEKAGTTVEKAKLEATSIVLSNGSVSDWEDEITAKLQKAAKAQIANGKKANPNVEYNEKEHITYMVKHMSVAFATELPEDDTICCVRKDVELKPIHVPFDKKLVTNFLDWASDANDEVYTLHLTNDGVSFVDEMGKEVKNFSYEKPPYITYYSEKTKAITAEEAPDFAEDFEVQLDDLVRTLRTFRTLKSNHVSVRFGDDVLCFTSHDKKNGQWNLFIPAKGAFGYSMKHAELCAEVPPAIVVKPSTGPTLYKS